jgi:hypothetical protein
VAIRGFLIGLGLALVVVAAPAWASTFHFSGAPIQGEDPTFEPDVWVEFDVIEDGAVLQITLTNHSSAEFSIGQALSGVYFDITTGSILTADTAIIGAGSMLVGEGANGYTDLSGEWGFKDDVSAGTLGSFGISSVGDVLFGEDSFGPGDRFDTSTNLFGPPSGSLNGISGAIVGPNITDFTVDGFKHHGPVVQNQMVFRLYITGEPLTMDHITNVSVLFGTDGAPAIPEPTSAMLFLVGALVVGKATRRAPTEA